jgi:hypothetical protein
MSDVMRLTIRLGALVALSSDLSVQASVNTAILASTYTSIPVVLPVRLMRICWALNLGGRLIYSGVKHCDGRERSTLNSMSSKKLREIISKNSSTS